MGTESLQTTAVEVAKPMLLPGPPTVEANLNIGPVDQQLQFHAPSLFHQTSSQAPIVKTEPREPLGVLANFVGVWSGSGFNQIWRPKPAKGGPVFKPEVNFRDLQLGHMGDDSVLELNLTQERLQFFEDLKQIPNRGFGLQDDIMLNGIPYQQSVDNATNPDSGLGDLKPPPGGKLTGIHFEPGLWIYVPPNQTSGASICRMASIPHGTSILAQGPAPSRGATNRSARSMPPEIPSVNFTPVPSSPKHFPPNPPQMEAGKNDTSRLPQNLEAFVKSGAIDQAVLRDPNEVLRRANVGKKFVDTEVFTVSTTPLTSDSTKIGISNIAFLQPNAEATKMTSTFWISTIEHTLKVPQGSSGTIQLSPEPKSKWDAKVPKFQLKLHKPTTVEQSLIVYTQQIQYSQTVILHFPPGDGFFDWPHVSVATLVPDSVLEVPASSIAKLK